MSQSYPDKGHSWSVASARDRIHSAQHFMARGEAAARAGNKAEARHHFNTVLELIPNHPGALLWMAYLAGGGHPSLVYLTRVLESDPANERARAAIRWARKRDTPSAEVTVAPRVIRPSEPSWRRVGATAGLLVLLLAIVGGLATMAFAKGIIGAPTATPTLAQLAIAVASSQPMSTDTPTPWPSAAPTETSAVVIVESSSPTAPPSPTSTATTFPIATATEPIPTPTNGPTPLAPPPSLSPTPLPSAPVGDSYRWIDVDLAYQRLIAYAGEEPTPTPTSKPTPVPPPPTLPPTPLPTIPIGDSFRWIDVDLTQQRLIAYQGEQPVRRVIVSTGLPRTPTVVGRFKVYVKYRAASMSGPGYHLENVPYVMYFFRGYGLHGTYWHNNFGQPMSHGCVNLPTSEAEWLFNWASVGTPVVVHY